MGLKYRFSSNLRRLCDASGKTYADVARALNLNRQQFNGYLSGKSLPNEQIIRNICNLFKIDLSELFVDPVVFTKKRGDTLRGRLNEALDIGKRLYSIEKPNISEGLYYIYFASPFYPKSILCSLLAISAEKDAVHFRRITRVSAVDSSSRIRRQAVHHGIVFSFNDSIVLLGLETSDEMPTMFSANLVFSPNYSFLGSCLVYENSYTSLSFVISHRLRNISVRKAMRKVGLQDIFKSDVDTEVLEALGLHLPSDTKQSYRIHS